MASMTKMAVLGGITAVAGMMLAGCTGSSGASSAPPTTSAAVAAGATQGAGPAVASTDQPRGPVGPPAHLAAPAGWTEVTVPLSSGGQRVGYEAATFDQHGHIAFWSDLGGSPTWAKLGESSYPIDTTMGAPIGAKVVGGQLAGMRHATFVLTGLFSNDGGLNAIAYTATEGARASNKWGAIKALPNGNLAPSGTPVGSDQLGEENEFDLVNGELETADCSATLPMAGCGGSQRVFKFWKWHGEGQQFLLSHTAGLSH